jgi:hypothetical protein
MITALLITSYRLVRLDVVVDNKRANSEDRMAV